MDGWVVDLPNRTKLHAPAGNDGPILREVTGPVTRGRLGDQKQPGTHQKQESKSTKCPTPW